MYIDRKLGQIITNKLNNAPAVALIGPRQCGKSTLAKIVLSPLKNSLYLDLERLNATRKPTQHMKFHLAGFESTSLLSYVHKPHPASMTDIEAALKDRDKAIAQKVFGHMVSSTHFPPIILG